jgi:hypothetical protein
MTSICSAASPPTALRSDSPTPAAIQPGQDTHSVISSISHLSGHHSLKIGVDMRLRRLNSLNLVNGGGAFSFPRSMTRGPNPFPDGRVALTRDTLGAKTFLGQGLSLWDPDAVTPYSLKWNLDLQRAMKGNFVLDLATPGAVT